MIETNEVIRLGYEMGGKILIGFYKPVFEKAIRPLLEKPAPKFITGGLNTKYEVEPDDVTRWGLSGLFSVHREEGDWVTLSTQLPVLFKGNSQRFNPGYTLVACFQKLFSLADISEDGDSKHKEMFSAVHMLANPISRGCGLGATIRSRLIRPLTAQGAGQRIIDEDRIILSISDAMKTTWPDSKKIIQQSYFRIFPDGRFIIGCFGDACDIAVYPENARFDDYWQVGCHNVDSPMQLFALFSGFAKLTELAREAGY